MPRISESQIIEQLQALSVDKSDILFVAADLMKMGYFNRSVDQTLKGRQGFKFPAYP